MVEDIRNVSAEEYWDKLREMMGADGLMTYRYLGRRVNMLDDSDTMRIRRDMRNAAGGLMASPLAIAAPETGGFTDQATVPAPVTYQLHVVDDGRDVGEIRIRRVPIHAGRSMGFSSSEIVDAADDSRVIAIVSGTGIKIGEAPPNPEAIDPPPDIPDSPSLPPLWEAFGAFEGDDGHWRLPELDAKHASTSASLHLGPIHVVLETEAAQIAADAAGTDQLQIEDWDVLFVAPGRVGPFVASGDAVTSKSGRTVCRLTLRDEGSKDRIVSWASAVYRPIS